MFLPWCHLSLISNCRRHVRYFLLILLEMLDADIVNNGKMMDTQTLEKRAIIKFCCILAMTHTKTFEKCHDHTCLSDIRDIVMDWKTDITLRSRNGH
jgi:hypothetical protein